MAPNLNHPMILSAVGHLPLASVASEDYWMSLDSPTEVLYRNCFFVLCMSGHICPQFHRPFVILEFRISRWRCSLQQD